MATSSSSSPSNRPRNAFVTLLTTDSYLPGALVLAHSIKRAHSNQSKLSTSDATNIPFDLICLVSTNNVKVQSIRSLRRVFDLVVGIEPLSISGFIAQKQSELQELNLKSQGQDKKKEINGRIRELAQRNLNLLGRPDLGEGFGDALTKLHAWRLTAYEKVVFLDADTIVLNPISHLFSLSSNLAAAPDVGWPDAFNSGVMVLTPSLETFDAIRTHAATNGTWDGADQGLLNEFFGGERGRGEEGEGGGWERLSFRYNATPNGGYTYAPAYQRYGSRINVAHFIGRHKPWHVPRPSPSASSSSSQVTSNDYNSLLSRWHSIYEENYPRAGGSGAQVDVIHSSRGVEVVERPFTVPTYEAVWDSELSERGQARRKSLHQRGNSSSRMGPGQVEDLKAIFNPGLVASAAAAEWNSRKFTAYSDDEIDNEEGIGFYYSFPLDGRVTLIPLAPLPWIDEEEEERKRAEQEKVELQRRIEEERQNQLRRAEQSRQSSNPNRSWSPPQVKWDPSSGPPPSGGGAADYQMRNPPDAYYQNAWDLPQPRTSNQAQRKAVFFKPQSGNQQIPAQLQREHFFDNLGSHRPDPSKIKAVFPWESRKSNPSPSRVFPDEPESVIPHSRELNHSHQAAATRPSNHTFDSNSSNDFSTSSSSNSNTVHHQNFDPPNHLSGGLPANLSYTNAWDQVGAIGKYADRVRRVTGSRTDQGQGGNQVNQDFSNTGGGGGGGGGGSRSASQSSKHRYRNRGSQSDGLGSDGNFGASLDGSGGVKGEGNGGSGENSDSRDGDDESSSGEEDSELDDSTFLTSPSSTTTKSKGKGGGSGGGGGKDKRNSTSSAKGYQRKAEAFAAAHSSPRSPRHHHHHLSLSNPNSASTSGSGSGSNGNGNGSGIANSNRSEIGSPPLQAGGSTTITGRARIRPEGFSRGSPSNSDSVQTPLARSPINPTNDFGGRS